MAVPKSVPMMLALGLSLCASATAYVCPAVYDPACCFNPAKNPPIFFTSNECVCFTGRGTVYPPQACPGRPSGRESTPSSSWRFRRPSFLGGGVASRAAAPAAAPAVVPAPADALTVNNDDRAQVFKSGQHLSAALACPAVYDPVCCYYPSKNPPIAFASNACMCFSNGGHPLPDGVCPGRPGLPSF